MINALVGAQLPAASRFVYDEENRLTQVRNLVAPLLTIQYDALGRRVETIDYQDGCTNGRRTRHIMSGLETIAEYVYSACTTGGGGTYMMGGEDGESVDGGLDGGAGTDGGGVDGGAGTDGGGAAGGGGPPVPSWNLAREFVWGASFTEPIALVDHTAAGDVAAGTAEVLHYVHDALGSVVGLTDAGQPNGTPAVPGKLVERYDYDPYGKTYIERWDASSSTWVRPASGRSYYGNPFAWTGQRYDGGVKLYHFPFRTYSPELGRWMQRDPLGYVETASLYGYVGSDPTSRVDPLGLDPNDSDDSDSSNGSAGNRVQEGAVLAASQGAAHYDVELAVAVAHTVAVAYDSRFGASYDFAIQVMNSEIPENRNAARHAAWMAHLTVTWGEEDAAAVGCAHEASCPPNDPDSIADKNNSNSSPVCNGWGG